MKELYVIDGTNLINVLSINTEPEQRKFGPLLQLLLAIMDRNESFFAILMQVHDLCLRKEVSTDRCTIF